MLPPMRLTPWLSNSLNGQAARQFCANRTFAALLLIIAIIVAGCSRDDDNASPDDGASKIEQLQALPYAGGVPGSEDDDRAGVTKFDEHWSQPGVNLYTIQHEARADLIDQHGNLLRSWVGERGGEWFHAELLDNGDVLAVGTDPPSGKRRGPGAADSERYLMRLNWDGDRIWKKNNTAHHDVELTPDGRIACRRPTRWPSDDAQFPGHAVELAETLDQPVGAQFVRRRRAIAEGDRHTGHARVAGRAHIGR